MKVQTARRLLLSLCAMLLLASCGLFPPRPQVVDHPQIIEVPVTTYEPVPDALTRPIAKPTRPPMRCTLNGKPAYCVIDALAMLPEYDVALDTCNADRATAAMLGKTDGQR